MRHHLFQSLFVSLFRVFAVPCAGVRLRVDLHLFICMCVFVFAVRPAGVRPRVDMHLFVLHTCRCSLSVAVRPAGVRPRVDFHLFCGMRVVVLCRATRRRPPPCGLSFGNLQVFWCGSFMCRAFAGVRLRVDFGCCLHRV